MREKLLEHKLRDKIAKIGGLAVKFTSPYEKGYPDRFIFLPEGKTIFVELKATGKKPTKQQEFQMRKLRKLGFEVLVIDNQEKLDSFLEQAQNGV